MPLPPAGAAERAQARAEWLGRRPLASPARPRPPLGGSLLVAAVRGRRSCVHAAQGPRRRGGRCQVRLAAAAGGARKLAPGALALFTDGEPGELVLSECSQLDPATLAPALASASGEQCAPPCNADRTWGVHMASASSGYIRCIYPSLGLCVDKGARIGMQTAGDAAAVQGASTGRLESARRQAPLARSRRTPCRVAGVSRGVRPSSGAPAPVRRRAAPRGAARRLERLELGLCGRGFGDETAATLAGAGPLPALRCARAAARPRPAAGLRRLAARAQVCADRPGCGGRARPDAWLGACSVPAPGPRARAAAVLGEGGWWHAPAHCIH